MSLTLSVCRSTDLRFRRPILFSLMSVTLLVASGLCAAQPAPTVSRVIPNNGPASGGIRITIRGSGFSGATRVTFGGNPSRDFRVISDSEVVAVLPAFPNPTAISPDGYQVDAAVCTQSGCSPQYLPGNFTYRRVQEPQVHVGGWSLTANGQLAQGFQYAGPCPVQLHFGWGVISTAPTTITYTFLRNDGGHLNSPRTTTISRADQSVPVYDDWHLGANTPEFANYRGWVELDIESPNHVSQRIGFTLHCGG